MTSWVGDSRWLLSVERLVDDVERVSTPVSGHDDPVELVVLPIMGSSFWGVD